MLHETTQAQVFPFRGIPTLVSGTLLALSTTLLLNGCAERSAVHAESQEIPLTSGDGNHVLPCYSPDGERIVYTSVEGHQANVIRLVDSRGGEASTVTKEPVPLLAMGWAENGQNLLVFAYAERNIQQLSFDGDLEPLQNTPEFSGLAKVSKDGRQALWCQFIGDNCDLVVQSLVDGKLETMVSTPQWELDSCFGPSPGDITFVRSSSYNSTTNKLYVRVHATQEEQLLPVPEGKANDPIWSPDRRYLAYISDSSDNNELWVFEAETQRAVQLTNTPEEESHPDWSPDGEWISFSRSVRTSKLFAGDPKTYERRPLTTGKGKDYYPRLSPDARWVAFFRDYPATLKKASRKVICVVSVETGEVQELDLSGLTPMVEEWVIGWSPDADEIAFPADDGTGNVDIYRLPREGGVPERVTIEPGLDTGPSWSPDGKTIAYMRLAGGESQIWTIPASGGLPRRISDGEGMNHTPAWAPDSDHLAYSRTLDAMKVELWVASTSDPSKTHRVVEAEPGNYAYAEAWTKDGSQILVWRMADETQTGYLIEADGSRSVELGRAGKDDTEHFVKLNKVGQQYFDLVYPGGVHVFADGERVSNIYTIRVPEIIEDRLSASGEAF